MSTELRLTEMEDSIEQLAQLQRDNGKKLDEVLTCIKGDDMGNTGLVKKVTDLTIEVQKIKDERVAEKSKSEIYLNIIKWLGGIIIALSIAYIFNQILPKQ